MVANSIVVMLLKAIMQLAIISEEHRTSIGTEVTGEVYRRSVSTLTDTSLSGRGSTDAKQPQRNDNSHVEVEEAGCSSNTSHDVGITPPHWQGNAARSPAGAEKACTMIANDYPTGVQVYANRSRRMVEVPYRVG